MASDRELQILLTLKDKASQEMKKVGNVFERNAETFRKVGTGLTILGGALTATGFKFVQLASDAEETQSKFNTIFRGIEDEMNSWATEFSNGVGRARQDIKGFTASLSDVLKPMGFTTKEAAKLSKEMVGLGLDVASFNNRADADVIHAFTSALTGERESLKTLGIVINEADVQQEAYRAGLVEVGEELTKTAKAQATVNLLFANSADAQGDLARTSESYANKSKALQATLKNLGETIGTKLLPAITPIVEKINVVLGRLAAWIEQNPKLAETVIKIVAVIALLTVTLGPLLIMLPGLTIAVGALGAAIGFLTSPIGLVILAVGALIATGLLIMKNWDKIKLAAAQLGNWLVEKFEIIKGAWTGLFEAIGTIANNAWEGIKNMIKGGINWIIEKINFFIRAANKVTEAGNKVPGVNIPLIPEIPKLAKGGIVKKPTIAMIGEGGPEAVVPLKKSNNPMTGNNITINVNGDVSGQELVEKVQEGIMQSLRFNQRLAI